MLKCPAISARQAMGCIQDCISCFALPWSRSIPSSSTVLTHEYQRLSRLPGWGPCSYNGMQSMAAISSTSQTIPGELVMAVAAR